MIIIEGFDHPTLTVTDLEYSIQFYEDNFDFEVVHKDSEANKVFLRINDILLALVEDKDYRSHPKSQNKLTFYLDAEDFSDAYDEIEERGLEIVQKSVNKRKGESVTIKDPDGYLIEILYPKIRF